METPEQTEYPDATEIFDDYVAGQNEVEALIEEYGEDGQGDDDTIYVTPMEYMAARLEAVQAVMAATFAQILGGDALTARNIYSKLNEDVARETNRYIQMADAVRKMDEAGEEE